MFLLHDNSVINPHSFTDVKDFINLKDMTIEKFQDGCETDSKVYHINFEWKYLAV